MDQKNELAGSPVPASGLEKDKNKALVESNAQTIFQDLTRLRAVPEGPRRWVWELLQNACDAVDRTRGVNRVRIEVGEGKLRFMHNGADFSGPEITHLIYHGSTKQEDEDKKGKFGSGFLTVHLISPKVLVRGVLVEDGVRKGFEFVLDRGGESAKNIEERMEEAWAQLLASRRAGVEPAEYTTLYEFELDEKAEAVVRGGLETLEGGLPYVLAFVEEIEGVTVATETETMSWCRSARDSSTSMLVTDVARTSPGKETVMFRIACAGDPEDGVGVAALFEKNGETWKCAVREEAPKLFYPLPLVGTHDLGIPFAVSSAGFEPMPERNGIYAGSLDDAPTRSNWLLLALVPGLFGKLLQGCIEKGWAGLEELTRFSGAFSGSWLERGRFRKEVLLPCIEHVRGETGPQILQNREARLLRVCEALVPVGESEGQLYELAERVLSVRDRLPSAGTHGKWASIFDAWAAIIVAPVDNLKYSLTLEKLGDEVEEVGSLEGLSKLLTHVENEEPLDWLNDMFSAVPKEKLPGFVKVRELVPNQLEFLKKEVDLWLDGGIDEDLKDICAKLGDPVRGELLHPGVDECVGELFRAVKGRVLTAEQCLDRAIKRVALPVEKGKEDAYQEGNAWLLAWLVARKRKEKLDSYPVVRAVGMGKLKVGERLLWPVGMWVAAAAVFADVFGEDRRFADGYTTYLSEKDWEYLEQEGFIYRSLFTLVELDGFEQSQVKESLETGEHEPVGGYSVSEIVFLTGESGILDGVRHSKQRCQRFLEFVLRHAIKCDRSWVDGYRVNCSCKETHTVTTGWVHDIRTHNWVYIGRNRSDRPMAATVSRILTDELKRDILGDPESARFLRSIGVSLGELVRAGVPEKDQERLDQLSARLFGSGDAATVESVEAVLDDADLQRVVLESRNVKRRVARNKEIGGTVEDLLRAALDDAKIRVKRTGIGSDFEVESDFIEEGREQFLEVSSFLVEVKCTTGRHVRMTLVQGREAVKVENRERYVLCVVDIGNDAPDAAIVRERARFVVGIGGLMQKEVEEASGLKDLEGSLSGSGAGPVGIDIVGSSVRLRINEVVWAESGVSFDAFVEKVKAVGAASVG